MFKEPENMDAALACEYSDDDTRFEAFTVAYRAGKITKVHVVDLANWKTPRIRRHFTSMTDEKIRELYKALRLAECLPRATFDRLLAFVGFGVPVTSTFMAAAMADKFTVADIRVSRTLGKPVKDWNWKIYDCYNRFVTNLAKAYGLSLRDMDRKLWAYGRKISRTRK